jgi:hypothetical protein
LALTSLVVALATFFGVPWVAQIYFAFSGLVFLAVAVLIAHLVFTTNFSYRVGNSSLVWELADDRGNEGRFTLTQKVVLARAADVIHVNTGLDEFVESFEPFPTFHPEYQGRHKKMVAFLRGHYPPGTEFDIVLKGRRNVTRVGGNTSVEIPIDFPVARQSVTITFTNRSATASMDARLLVRFAGEVVPAPSAEQSRLSSQPVGTYYQIEWERAHPSYGHSYIISWFPPRQAEVNQPT